MGTTFPFAARHYRYSSKCRACVLSCMYQPHLSPPRPISSPLPHPSPTPCQPVQGASCVCTRTTRTTSPYDRAASPQLLPPSSASDGAPTGASPSCTRGKWAGPWVSLVSSLETHRCICNTWLPRNGWGTRSVVMAVMAEMIEYESSSEDGCDHSCAFDSHDVRSGDSCDGINGGNKRLMAVGGDSVKLCLLSAQPLLDV